VRWLEFLGTARNVHDATQWLQDPGETASRGEKRKEGPRNFGCRIPTGLGRYSGQSRGVRVATLPITRHVVVCVVSCHNYEGSELVEKEVVESVELEYHAFVQAGRTC
jgi:hypothetical protein